MPHDDCPIDLARYLAGELPPSDIERLDEWLQADPARRQRLEKLRELWARAADQPSGERVDEVWAALSSKLALEKPGKPALALHNPRRRWHEQRGSAPSILAAISIAAAASIALLLYAPAAPEAPAPTFKEYATKNAQRADIRLSDGSRVVLAPASRLLVPDAYNVKTRDLRLEGEAYFDIFHNDAKPFTVRTPNTTTRDLGTAFAVTDYPTDRQAQVIVAEGEVGVLSARDTNASTLQLLKRGDLARVTATGTITRSRVTNLDRRLAWLRGGLAFDDVPLGDALKQIARWYDLDIRVADSSLASRRLIATIGNEPAADVLRLVALTLGLRVEHVEGSRLVTLHPK